MSKADERELKNCPFCGSKAKIVKYESAGWLIACTGADCSIEIYGAYSTKRKDSYDWKYWTKAKTIKAWNTRVGLEGEGK